MASTLYSLFMILSELICFTPSASLGVCYGKSGCCIFFCNGLSQLQAQTPDLLNCETFQVRSINQGTDKQGWSQDFILRQRKNTNHMDYNIRKALRFLIK